jgi:hypothetical protein
MPTSHRTVFKPIHLLIVGGWLIASTFLIPLSAQSAGPAPAPATSDSGTSGQPAPPTGPPTEPQAGQPGERGGMGGRAQRGPHPFRKACAEDVNKFCPELAFGREVTL